MVAESQITNPSERIQVGTCDTAGLRQVKIRVESFDERLGWYSSGSVLFGIDQLPLLEQAIAEMRACERSRRAHHCEIIPFPGMNAASAAAAS